MTADTWSQGFCRGGSVTHAAIAPCARAAITQGFHAGVRMFADIPFDFAGVPIVLGERPAVSFLCTHVGA